MILKKLAMPVILTLVGLAAQFSGYASAKATIAILVVVVLWVLTLIPFRSYVQVLGSPIVLRSPLALLHPGDAIFTPALLQHVSDVIASESNAPRTHVVSVTPEFHLTNKPPYILFDLRFFNGSIFNLRLDGTIRGRIAFLGQDYDRDPEFVEEVARQGVPHGSPFTVRIRQWLTPDAAAWFMAQRPSGSTATFRFRLA